MKLLFDANLSPHLAKRLMNEYPGSAHVLDFDLPSDRAIWDHAASLGYVIGSKDTDFYNLSMVHGAPPKVVWLRLGDAGTSAIADLLVRRKQALVGLAADSEAALLILDKGA